MTNFILHIGYSKTGTTAIQHFLHHNRAALAKARTLYPDFFIQGAWLDAQNHNFLGHALAGRTGWWGRTAEELICQIEDQLRNTSADRVILSAEAFLGGVRAWDFNDEASYHEACQAAVTRLAQALDRHKVQIVVYLRRQDQWLESILNHNIKYSGLLSAGNANVSVEDTCRIYEKRIDYANVLAPWRATFGKESLSVGVYEKSQLSGGDVVTDFRERIGLTMPNLTNPTLDSLSANRGFNRDVLEFKKILNRIARPKYEELAIVECLHGISDSLSVRESQASAPILSVAQRCAILDRVAKSNAEVARDHLGCSDGILFREALPDPKRAGSDYAGLDTSVAMEILLRLDRELHSTRGRSRLFRHWLAEKLRVHAPWMHGFVRRLRAFGFRPRK